MLAIERMWWTTRNCRLPSVSIALPAFAQHVARPSNFALVCRVFGMDQTDSAASRAQLSPDRWLEDHGDYLYGFALARLGQPEAAEDLVQETLLAALQARSGFSGQSSERTWLIGILKHKLIDRLRRRSKSQPFSELGGDEWLDGLYDRTGHWRQSPGSWGHDPAVLFERREFWEAFERCRGALPERLQTVFALRLLDRVPAEDVCQALTISAANLWTLLHRARVRLWKCLDGDGRGPTSTGTDR